MKAPLFKNSKGLQRDVKILVDASFAEFLRKKGNLMDHSFVSAVERGMKKGMALGVGIIRSEMGSMNAVATGFMRKTVGAELVAVKYGREPEIMGVFGTKAWYDILVHEGLGYHSSSGKGRVPSKYKPSPEQLAIVEPDAKARRAYYKPSPRRPRPFLKTGVQKALPVMVKAITTGIIEGLGRKRMSLGKPNIDMTYVLGGRI
jgi:hypothetical protein